MSVELRVASEQNHRAGKGQRWVSTSQASEPVSASRSVKATRTSEGSIGVNVGEVAVEPGCKHRLHSWVLRRGSSL